MPGGDRTGPSGEGPMTGRRMGYCKGNAHSNFMYRQSNRGRGYGRAFRGTHYRGRGLGFGSRHGFGNLYLESNPDVQEKTMIENQISILKDQLSFWEEKLSNAEKK